MSCPQTSTVSSPTPHLGCEDVFALTHQVLYVSSDDECTAAFLQHVLRTSMWTHVDQMATEPHVQLVQAITALSHFHHYLAVFASPRVKEDCRSWALVGFSDGCVGRRCAA
jgi:Ni,Fe-hydrogenase I cytochrome b subunit